MNYHSLNSTFSVTYKPSGTVVRYVVRDAETWQDKEGNTYRVGCSTCAFSVRKEQYVNGCIRLVSRCRFAHPMEAKCTPEYREDGRIVEFKRIKTA